MSACIINVGGTWYDTFETEVNGARTDADALPTVTGVFVNGVWDTSLTATITQAQDGTPANITGLYNMSIDLSSLNEGDHVSICVEATMSGKTVSSVKEARVRAASSDTCSIRF